MKYENKCCKLCHRPLLIRKYLPDEFYELDIIKYHPYCRILFEKEIKLKRDMLNLEWEIFKVQHHC